MNTVMQSQVNINRSGMNRTFWKMTIRDSMLNHLVKIFPFMFFVVLLFAGPTYLLCQEQKMHLRLGYSIYAFQDISPSDANAAIKVYAETFREKFEKRVNKKVAFSTNIYNSVENIIEALNNNEVDLISLLATEYFQIKKTHNIYPLLATTSKEDAYEQYCFMVRNDLGIKQIKDLRGKILAMPNPEYNPLLIEWLYNFLAKNKMNEAQTTFKTIKLFDKESNAIYDLFFKNSDCAIIRKSVFTMLCELNPQIKYSISEFAASKPMIVAFLVANKNSDQDLMKITTDEMQKFHLSHEGKNILKIFKAKTWMKLSDSELKSVEELLNENASFRKINLVKSKKRK